MLRIIQKVFILAIMSISGISHAQEYYFTSIEKLITQQVAQIVITDIYKKLGLTIIVEPRPANRAQIEVESDLKDGEILRIWTYGNENTSVIRVPTPYLSLKTTAFIKRSSNVIIKSKEDLKKLRIVTVTGIKHTNNITEGMPNVYDIYNNTQMMRYLNAGRADVALTAKINGLYTLAKHNFDEIVAVEKPLAELNLYHYVHKKHKDLVPQLDKVIREMKQSGELELIIQKAQNEVLNK